MQSEIAAPVHAFLMPAAVAVPTMARLKDLRTRTGQLRVSSKRDRAHFNLPYALSCVSLRNSLPPHNQLGGRLWNRQEEFLPRKWKFRCISLWG